MAFGQFGVLPASFDSLGSDINALSCFLSSHTVCLPFPPLRDGLQVERFRAQGLKKVKQEDAQGRLNLEMANVRFNSGNAPTVLPTQHCTHRIAYFVERGAIHRRVCGLGRSIAANTVSNLAAYPI